MKFSGTEQNFTFLLMVRARVVKKLTEVYLAVECMGGSLQFCILICHFLWDFKCKCIVSILR